MMKEGLKMRATTNDDDRYRCHVCGHRVDLYNADKKSDTWSAGCPICMTYVSGTGPENALKTWEMLNNLRSRHKTLLERLGLH